MPFITGDVAVKEISPTEWELLQDVVYTGHDETFTVPVGFHTDFASVPRIFFWLIPTYGAYTKAAILHDFLCNTLPISRADADGLFRRAMRELNVPFLRRWMMWAAVRAASGLKGAKLSEVLVWLLITVPAVVFLLVPAVVVVVWLAMFWLLENALYVLFRLFARRKPTRRPKFLPSVRP
jgi:hypothetical protein